MFKRRSNSIVSRHIRDQKNFDTAYRRALRFETLEDRRMLAVLTVDTPLDTVNLGDGLLSLREAIFVANTVAGADTIQFDFGHDGPETILLTEGELVITDSLVIEGLGADLLMIDASGNDPTPDENNGDGSRVFAISDNDSSTLIDVEIIGLTLTGGDLKSNQSPSFPNGRGGAIVSSESLTLIGAHLVGNFAPYGGGIASSGGVLKIVDSLISGNQAIYGGGGIDGGGEISIISSHIFSNTTDVGGGGGRGGGGIRWVSGNLSIDDSVISGNSTGSSAMGGGILFNHFSGPGHLQIRGSTISGNSTGGSGGAIWSGVGSGSVLLEDNVITENTALAYGGGIHVNNLNGDIAIRRTTIRDNSADSGGGISVFDSGGTFLVEESLVSENTAFGNPFGGGSGGGMELRGSDTSTFIIRNSTVAENAMKTSWGGGIAVPRGHLILESSTISSNSAGFGGGIASSNGALLTIRHSTITANIGGGIQGNVTLDHTIVAGNHDTGGATLDVAGIANAQYSLVGFGAEYLGPLADNGGPTPTHALLPGSPAINVGDLNAVVGVDGLPSYDQRGEPFARIVGGRIDIGAFEYQEPSDLNLLVDTLVDESDGDYSRGDLSLREAIELANANDYPDVVDTIRFDPALAGGTILLTMGELVISDSLVIEGLGAELLTIDASGNDPTPDENNGDGSRVFRIDDGNTQTIIDVEIIGLTLTGGDLKSNQSPSFPNGRGGAIVSSESLTLIGTHLVGNFAPYGGGIASSGGVLTIKDSLISENIAVIGGGGIDGGGEISIISSHIVSNATVGGSGIGSGGGGIRWASGNFSIDDSVISDNSTGAEGGGIFIRFLGANRKLEIRHSSITGNLAGKTGGGISALAIDGAVLLKDVVIAENQAVSNGGGLYVLGSNGDLTIRRTTIRDNSSESGSGISVLASSGTFLVDESFVSENRAIGNPFGGFGDGGGIELNGADSSTFTIRRSTVAGNDVNTGRGGGVSISRGHLILESSTISSNSAGFGGGIASSNGALLTIRHSTITANTGGGIQGNVTLDHTTVAGNHDSGGATLEVAGVVTSQYSLIGFGSEFLGPLADNGGPTMTHALLPGSPAIDAGDPNAMAGVDGVPTHDQRGAPFIRVYDGRIDIGAVEWMPEGFLPGDFNSDGKVSAGDSTIWMDTLHSTTDLRADANADGVVDYADREIWMAHFGLTTDALPPVEGAAVGSSSFLEGVVDETNQSTSVSNQESAPGRSRLVEAVFHEFGSPAEMNRRLLPISTAPHSERNKDLLLLADLPRDHAFAGDHWRTSRSMAAEVQDITTDFGWDSFPDAEYELAAVLAR